MSETLLDKRVATIKSLVIEAAENSTASSNSIAEQSEERQLFQAAGALAPPYTPKTLADIYENSSILRPAVDAYSSNIHGHGFHLQPLLQLDSDDVNDMIANAIYIERLIARKNGQIVPVLKPTEEEIAARRQAVSDEMRLEEFEAAQFFATCTVDESFISLRRKTCEDYEVTGNAYWEVMRDRTGTVSQFGYLPAPTMRLMKLDPQLVDVAVPVRTSPLSVGQEKMKRRFRKFVQLVSGAAVYFKEYGDQRIMSAKSGRYYKSTLEMNNAEAPGVDTLANPEKAPREATEVIHFKIHSSSSAYGVPRWIGALLAVLGTRHAEDVNYLYFENKSVPPLALLVSGATLSDESVQRIESYIENNVKGKKNFHKILIIEADTQASDLANIPGGRVRIEFKPLTQAQQSDAQFLKYDERNMDKVGMAFRLPRLLRGDSRDFNRATAESALEFAESQIFGPERSDFDHYMTKFILEPMGIRYWTFVSNSVQIRDPKVVAEMIERLSRVGALVPRDARKLAEEMVFNRKLPNINADWLDQPVMLTQVGVPLDTSLDGEITGLSAATAPSPRSSDEAGGSAPISFGVGKQLSEKAFDALVRDILKARAILVEQEERLATESFVKNKKADIAKNAEEMATTDESTRVDDADTGPEVITLPLDEMVERFALTLKSKDA